MSCEDWKQQAALYLDGELGDEETRRLEAHLRTCPPCNAALASGTQLKRMVRLAGHRFEPAPEFRRRIEQQVAAPRQRTWFARWMPQVSALTALLLVVMLAGIWALRSPKLDAYGELADMHVSNLASANPVDVVSSDRHTVKPWFQGKLPFTFNVPEMNGTPYTLIGGRLTYFHQTPGAHLLFGIRQHKISVLIFQDRPEIARVLPATQGVTSEHSFNMETWSDHGLRFVAISDVDRPSLEGLGTLLKAAN